MYIKLLASLIIFIIAIAEKFWIKDSENQKKRKLIFIILLTCSLSFSLYTIIQDQVDTNANLEKQSDYQDSLVKQNDSLKTRIGTLQTNLDSLINLEHTYEKSSGNRDIVLQAKVDELNTQLEPFIKLAIRKYPNMKIEEALDKIQADLEETKKLAQPNTIKFHHKEVTQTSDGYTLRLYFSKTKNEPLGQIQLIARMLGVNATKIIDIWPTEGFAITDTGPDSKFISPNSKNARLIYSIIGGGEMVVDIKTTGNCRLRIEGNNGLESFYTDI